MIHILVLWSPKCSAAPQSDLQIKGPAAISGIYIISTLLDSCFTVQPCVSLFSGRPLCLSVEARLHFSLLVFMWKTIFLGVLDCLLQHSGHTHIAVLYAPVTIIDKHILFIHQATTNLFNYADISIDFYNNYSFFDLWHAASVVIWTVCWFHWTFSIDLLLLYEAQLLHIKGDTHAFSWILTVTGGWDGSAPVLVAFNKTAAFKLEVPNKHLMKRWL